MSLPCTHMIERRLAAHQILNLYNINQHWWIDRSILPQQDLTEDDQLEQLLEKFNQQYNSWTVPFAFELEELKTTSRKYGVCNNIGHNSKTCSNRSL
ncbi:14307_t:CDS:2 [Gigaspora rosea]|nr:14307_t:CDS:2 [Gigaspora rosea]